MCVWIAKRFLMGQGGESVPSARQVQCGRSADSFSPPRNVKIGLEKLKCTKERSAGIKAPRWGDSNRVRKHTALTWFDKLTTGFDTFRANGTGIEIVGNFPFVLSPLRLRSGQALSKHENGFFSSLLKEAVLFRYSVRSTSCEVSLPKRSTALTNTRYWPGLP